MFAKTRNTANKQPAAALANLSWEADIVSNMRRSESRAWRVAMAGCGTTVIMAIALALLVPLHRVVPYVVTVDKLTGEAAVVTTDGETAKPNSMADKHWIKAFVIARERYFYQLVQQDYNTVRRLAGPGPWPVYAKLFDGDESLDKKYAENIEVTPRILSVTLNGDGLATVRFELSTRDKRTPAEPVVKRLIATMRYAYEKKSLSEAEAIENPFGFTVLGYQTDPELIAEGVAK